MNTPILNTLFRWAEGSAARASISSTSAFPISSCFYCGSPGTWQLIIVTVPQPFPPRCWTLGMGQEDVGFEVGRKESPMQEVTAGWEQWPRSECSACCISGLWSLCL